MAIDWTPEKLSKLPDSDLVKLLPNLKHGGATQAVEDCEKEMKLRKIKPNLKLEEDLCRMLIEVWEELSKTYDFDPKLAKLLSKGTKNFIAHKFLDSHGQPKTGGAHKQARVVFDRYISYRLGSEVYALLVILYKNEGLRARYQVFGPSRLLDGFVSLNQIRPYLDVDEAIGVSAGGLEYDTFEEAAEKFKWLIGQVAPKLK